MSKVSGTVAPGFEPVRDAIAALAAPWGRGGGGIAAFVDGKPVVDLWGGTARPGVPWQADTLAPLASVTKSWAAIIIGRLYEQGLVDYTTPIARWWPEFAAEGKQDVTLHHIFEHSSGVLGFDGQVEFLGAGGNAGWHDLDGIAAKLAAARPAWEPGTRHGYHAVSYGWLLNEVVRRVSGHTIGELFARDVAGPLGLDSHLGTSAADQPRLPTGYGADLSKAPWVQRKLLSSFTRKGSNPQSLAGRALLADGTTTILDRAPGLMSDPQWVSSEVPASNGTSTPRSLARLFACLAGGGELDGVRILGAETVGVMSQVHSEVTDVVMTEPLPALLRRIVPKGRTTYGLMPNLVVKKKLQCGPNPRTFMSAGFGGQVVFADPDARISFASTCTDLTPGLDAAIQQPAIAALYASL